jgi:hypothetical protein
MDDKHFLDALNRAVGESGVDLSAPATASDPASVAAWAGFLRRAVALGVSIADPRWKRLEAHTRGGVPGLRLAVDANPEPAEDDETDFTLGLSLLMSMLGRTDGRD